LTQTHTLSERQTATMPHTSDFAAAGALMKTRQLALAGLLLAALAPQARACTMDDLFTGLVDFTGWSLFGHANANNLTQGNGFTCSLLELTQPEDRIFKRPLSLNMAPRTRPSMPACRSLSVAQDC
jgi:hypothetical protein